MDIDIEHMNATVDFLLFSPFDVWVYAVYVCEEGVCVVVVDGYERVICLAEPEED